MTRRGWPRRGREEPLGPLRDDIAFLQREAWRANDPIQKFHLYQDLIGLGLQAIDDAIFRTEVARDLEGLRPDADTYLSIMDKGYSAEDSERLHCTSKLGQLTVLWSRVAARLRAESISERSKPLGLRNPASGIGWPRQIGSQLLAASALFLATNVFLLAAAFLGILGSAPWGLDAASLVYLALFLDIPAAVLLALFLLGGARASGNPQPSRQAGWLLLTWAGLSVAWRYVLPAILGTDYQALLFDLFATEGVMPPNLAASPHIVGAILGLWASSACIFFLAHALLLKAGERPLGPEGPNLPVRTWLVSAALSLAGTLLLVHAIAAPLLGWGSGFFLAGVLLKLVIAPNLFLGAYARGIWAGLGLVRQELTSQGTAPGEG